MLFIYVDVQRVDHFFFKIVQNVQIFNYFIVSNKKKNYWYKKNYYNPENGREHDD